MDVGSVYLVDLVMLVVGAVEGHAKYLVVMVEDLSDWRGRYY